MTQLWIAAAVMTLVVLAALLLPLMKRRKDDDGPTRSDFDLTVYKDQLLEIEKDLDRGVLSQDQAMAARVEIERRMLATTEGNEDAPATNKSAPGWLIAVILVMVPVGAVALYLNLGQPKMKDLPYASRDQQQPQMAAKADRRTQIEKMIVQIEQRLKTEPNNPRNWAMLGQANQMIGNFKESIQAYEKLVAMTKRNPDALMVLGEALFVEAGEVVTPRAVKLFKEAKKGAPRNPMTYYYLGMERQMANDPQGALDEFSGLLTISPSDGEWVATIQARMKAIAQSSGLDVPVVEMLPPLSKQKAKIPALSQDQIDAAQGMSAGDQQTMIRAMVARLADKMKKNPNDLQGWKRLANAYGVLGDQAKQAEAEAQIKRLSAQ